jgi:hypothetical protein
MESRVKGAKEMSKATQQANDFFFFADSTLSLFFEANTTYFIKEMRYCSHQI